MPGSNATGLMLALLTALFWGALPLALKHLLSTVDALSIVCLRFSVAAAWTRDLSCRHPGNSTPLGRQEKILLVLAAAGLSCNFVFFQLVGGLPQRLRLPDPGTGGPRPPAAGQCVRPARALPPHPGGERHRPAWGPSAVFQYPAAGAGQR